MADEKISQLVEATVLADTDQDVVVQNFTTTPVTRRRPFALLKSTLKVYFDTFYITGHVGSSPPGTPTVGMLWWDTTNAILWVYGLYAGANRWVSAKLFSAFGGAQTSATAAAFIHTGISNAINAGFDIYIATLFFKHFVITTNNVSNYWRCNLRKVSGATAPAAGAGTQLATCNTSASSANVWTEVTASVDAVIDFSGSGMEFPFLDVAFGAGTPGNLWYSLGISYRLVRP